MKVVILAGGMGTRLMEETELRPKPMVEIGKKPILWHIMKYYNSFGFDDFIVCLGYKGNMIKDYFLNYQLHNSDISVDISKNKIKFIERSDCNFKVTLIETGYETNTAGRLFQVKKYINNETFMMTYGDGLSDIDLNQLIKFHRERNSIATLTSIIPNNTFGIIKSNNEGYVESFSEKIDLEYRINGGFFVLEPQIFEYLDESSYNIQWEKGPLKKISEDGKLTAFPHNGFWKCMDALRDKVELEELWKTNPPWKIW